MKKLILLLAVIFINCGNVNAQPSALLEGEVLANFEDGQANVITKYQGTIYKCKIYFTYEQYKCEPLKYRN